MTAHSGSRQAGASLPPVALSVVLVADSPSRVRALRALLGAPGFSVAAEALSAESAEAAVVEHEPGAVLLDLDPSAGGLEAIERIMGTRPTPIVICGELAPHAQAALAAGAVDVIGALDALPGSPQYATAVQRHLRIASRVRVITHPRNRLRVRGLAAASQRDDGRDIGSDRGPAPAGRRNSWASAPGCGVRVVVIGASTGGPPALATILTSLPRVMPVPVLVVQHMADGFMEGLASWLDGVSPLPVVVAQDGWRLQPGTVYLAPAGSNSLVRHGMTIELTPPTVGQFHVPGVDAAFASVAATCGAQAVGVLLTGMGRDGAIGLRSMYERGAVTIGQDEPTSVVWGMPAAAQALGAVEHELPLPDIADAIVAAVREHGRPSGAVASPNGPGAWR